MSKRRRRRRRRRRARHWGRTLLLSILIGAGLYAGAHCLLQPPEQKTSLQGNIPDIGEHTALTGEGNAAAPSSHYERKEDFYTILLSGVDDGYGGSDTNILAAIDAKNGYIYGVSIPRDSKAVYGGKSHKINSAYNVGGMEFLAEVVSDQLGIPIDYTILVKLRGFEALVDAIDGVDFYIPVHMDYDDPVQDLHIQFPKGQKHLTGAEALKVVRFRHNNDGSGYGSEDIGRMETQQNFLKAVAAQTLTPASLTKLDKFVKLFDQYVETDLSLGNLAWLGTEAISMGAESVSFSTLPGEWKSPYIYLDQKETLALVNGYLNPYVEDRIPEDLDIPSR